MHFDLVGGGAPRNFDFGCGGSYNFDLKGWEQKNILFFAVWISHFVNNV